MKSVKEIKCVIVFVFKNKNYFHQLSTADCVCLLFIAEKIVYTEFL